MISVMIALTLESSDFDQSRLEAAWQRLEHHIRQQQIPGAVVMVLRNGKTALHRASGFMDLETREKMTTSTLFQVKSMTKPVTAAAFMICVERGLVGLNDPVSKYFPKLVDIKIRRPDGSVENVSGRLTCRHLLNHTSGLSSDDPGGISDEAKAKMTLASYRELIGTEPLLTQPGEAIRYSGVGFSVIAAIVETVSGRPFDRFVQEEIFGPLGMKSTYFFLPSSQAARLAQVYIRSDRKLVPFDEDRFRSGARFPNGAGGLYSTAQDMAQFIQAFSGVKNKLLSPASCQLMTTLSTGTLLSDGSDAQGYGLGWAVIRSSAGQSTLRSIGSFGHTGAFGTEYWHDPITGISLVFLTQGFGLSDEPRRQFSTMINAALR